MISLTPQAFGVLSLVISEMGVGTGSTEKVADLEAHAFAKYVFVFLSFSFMWFLLISVIVSFSIPMAIPAGSQLLASSYYASKFSASGSASKCQLPSSSSNTPL